MAEAALVVCTFLLHYQLSREKRQDELTTLGVLRNESRSVAVDRRDALGVTDVHVLHDVFIDTIELNLEFAVTDRQNPKCAFVETIDTIGLRGGNDFLFL